MAIGTKVSALTELAKGSVDPDADFIPIVDTDASTTKKSKPVSIVADAIKALVPDQTDADLSDEILWPTADSNTGPLVINVAETPRATTPQTDGSGNPKIRIGYNLGAGGNIYTGDFGAAWCIEGHWDSDDAGNYLMEGYLEFGDTSGVGYAAQRPFMATYDESESLINLCKLQTGTGYDIKFIEVGADGNGVHTFGILKTNAAQFLGDNNDTNIITFSAGTGQNMLWRFGCNGDDVSTAATMRWSIAPWGGGGVDRQVAIFMGDGSTATTGAITFRYDTTAGYSAPLVNIGATNSVTTALLSVDHANVPTSIHTAQLIAKASQTGAMLNVDGITSAGATEANKWQLFPKGSISVKPSGGAVTAPQTGANTVTQTDSNSDTITWSNYPGTNQSGGPDMWFPMLDATGALFWVPGWSA